MRVLISLLGFWTNDLLFLIFTDQSRDALMYLLV